ncbi:MAG: glycosyltransferase family 2 protein [Bacteroidota bacterium]
MEDSSPASGCTLTILILVYSDVAEGTRLYEQLQQEIEDQDYRILLIDNDCKDKKLLRDKVPERNILVADRNRGYAGGNNIGVNRCLKDDDKFLMILNPDIEISIQTIDALVSKIAANPQIAFLGPRISYRNNREVIYSDGGLIVSEKGFKVTHLNHRKNRNAVKSGINDVDYMNGSALLGRVEAIRQFGPMRDEFFIYFEETEWCLRAKDHGWKVQSDTTLDAFHLTSPKNSRYHFLMKRNRIWLAKIRKTDLGATVRKTLWECVKETLFLKKKSVAFWYGLLHGLKFDPEEHQISNRRFFKL